jgi:hypothetical protein
MPACIEERVPLDEGPVEGGTTMVAGSSLGRLCEASAGVAVRAGDGVYSIEENGSCELWL